MDIHVLIHVLIRPNFPREARLNRNVCTFILSGCLL
jgi:hypothetical protein